MRQSIRRTTAGLVAALAAAAVVVAVMALAGTASARQPASPVELRITATGSATATLIVDGYPLDISAVVNHEHPAGWTGEGRLLVQAVGGDASCRVVVNGQVVSEQSGGPVAVCRYP